MATAQLTLESAEQAFIDQVIAKRSGRPGELLGILEAVQERNAAQVSPSGNPAIHRQPARHSAVPDLQRGHVLCAVQPGAAGRPHHLHLPRHRLPHARLAQPAGEPAAGAGPGTRTTTKPATPTSSALTTPDGKFTDAHRGLLRAVRAGAGGGGGSPHLRPRERAGAAARGASTLERERRMMPRIQDIGTFNAVREAGMAKLLPPVPRIAVGMGTCGRGNGAEGVYHAFAEAIDRSGTRRLSRRRRAVSAPASQEPLVNVRVPGPAAGDPAPRAGQRRRTHPATTSPPGNVAAGPGLCKIEEWDHLTGHIQYGSGYPEMPSLERGSVLQGRRRRSCCATAGSSIPTTSRSTSRSAATRRSTRC